MPQTDFYLCEADLLELGETFFGENGFIVPALEYSTPVVLKISHARELKKTLRTANPSLLFVISPAWERSPLVVRSVEKKSRHVFYVSQKEGGPTLDIFYVPPRSIKDELAVGAGFISYHNRFWNPATQKMELAPSPLISAYRTAVSRLKRHGRTVVRRHRKVFVTQNTLSSGLKLLDLKKHYDDAFKIIDGE